MSRDINGNKISSILNIGSVNNNESIEEKKKALLEKYDKSPLKENINVMNSLKIVMKDFTQEYILLTYKPSHLFIDINIICNLISITAAFITLYLCQIYKFNEFKIYLPFLCLIYFSFCYLPQFYEYIFRNNLVFSGTSKSVTNDNNNTMVVYLKQDPKVLYKFNLEISQWNLINKEVCDVTKLFYDDGIFNHRLFTEILDRALLFKKNE